jgi:capsular exopolysaccharide synthesis family protein
MRADQLTLVDPAIAPTKRTKPPLLLLLLAGSVGSLLLGALAVLLVNAMDDRVHTPLLAESAGIPVLGLLPREEGGDFAAGTYESGYLRGVHAIRARLMFGQGDASRALMVTGATPDDLEQGFSAALAISAAQIGARVLLVETDMLQPVLAEHLRLRPEGGLSLLLAGESTAAESILPYPGVPRLSVLTAGPIPADPTVLIASEAMTRLLATLQAQYDLIILAGPPAQFAAADVSALAELADLSVQVARMDATTRAALAHVHDLVARHSRQAVGVVFVDVSPESSAFRNFYGYDPQSSSYRKPSYETV